MSQNYYQEDPNNYNDYYVQQQGFNDQQYFQDDNYYVDEQQYFQDGSQFFQYDENQSLYDSQTYPQEQQSLENNQTYNETFENNMASLKLKRLNAYDSAILEDNSYIKLDDSDLKIKERIKRFEEFLEKLDDQIALAYMFQYFDEIATLENERQSVLEKIEQLKEEYQHKNIFFSIDLKLQELKEQFIQNNDKVLDILKKFNIFGYFEPLYRSSKLKSNLKKLNKINRNVSELLNQKVPYGENAKRYQSLAVNLSKANYLNSKIAKNVK